MVRWIAYNFLDENHSWRMSLPGLTAWWNIHYEFDWSNFVKRIVRFDPGRELMYHHTWYGPTNRPCIFVLWPRPRWNLCIEINLFLVLCFSVHLPKYDAVRQPDCHRLSFAVCLELFSWYTLLPRCNYKGVIYSIKQIVYCYLKCRYMIVSMLPCFFFAVRKQR